LKVQLSKQPSKTAQDLVLRDQSYFKTAKIDLLLDTEVTNINWYGKSLMYKRLGNQTISLQYDYLVLATGLRPRKLPSSLLGYNLRNIFYLRSLEDANNLVSKF
jgi:NADPH-dependent 2,4-dienoyl-CoA reductase/sulfur reductase-like enzyme